MVPAMLHLPRVVVFGLFATLAIGCPPPAPGPVGPRPVQGPGPVAPPTAPPTTGPTAATPTNPDLPIDPAQPMPVDSLSTGATLELGKPATVVIDGRADIYSAGLAQPDAGRGGKLPAVLALVTGGGYLTFSNVKGVVGCMAGATTPPDGGDCAGGNTDIRAANGISGIVHHQRTQFLVGLFLGPSASLEAPPNLDFSAGATGDAFGQLAPVLGQTFFIGDGFTSSGLNQRFVVPNGATRFYLGFADAYGFQGDPGAYGDNTGGLHVTLTQQR
jgi:hypothetical protein